MPQQLYTLPQVLQDVTYVRLEVLPLKQVQPGVTCAQLDSTQERVLRSVSSVNRDISLTKRVTSNLSVLNLPFST